MIPADNTLDWRGIKMPRGVPSSWATLPTRALTVDEQILMRRRFSRPIVVILRIAATLLALSGIILCGVYLAHPAVSVTDRLNDRLALMAGIIVTLLAAELASGIALSMVRDFRKALRYGRAVEIYGIPASGSRRWLTVGSVELVIPRRLAEAVKPGEMHQFVIALGAPSRPVGAGRLGKSWPRGVLVMLDGKPTTGKNMVSLRWPPELQQAATIATAVS